MRGTRSRDEHRILNTVFTQRCDIFFCELGERIGITVPIDSIEYFERLSHAVSDPALKSAITNLVRKRPKPAV